MFFTKLFIGVFVGYSLHLLHNPTNIFGFKWRNIVRYVLGYLGALPVLVILSPDEQSARK